MSDLEQPSEFPLSFDALDYLKETAKWAYMLSIMGFVFVGLLALMAFALGPMISSIYAQSGAAMPSSMFTVIYLALAVVYFFPVLYLFKFARFTKKAIANQNTTDMATGFKNLKSHYKFIGILTIVILAFYALFFVFFLIGGALPTMMA